jgi:CheY-like chemotaxis protein
VTSHGARPPASPAARLGLHGALQSWVIHKRGGRPLLERLELTEGNFAQMAHVVAFSRAERALYDRPAGRTDHATWRRSARRGVGWRDSSKVSPRRVGTPWCRADVVASRSRLPSRCRSADTSFLIGPFRTYRFGTGCAPISPMERRIQNSPGPSGLRVLVIEDDDDARDALVRLLQTFGVYARAARDGQEALQLVPEVQPAVILCDLQMPRLDGVEFVKRLRRLPPSMRPSPWRSPDSAGRWTLRRPARPASTAISKSRCRHRCSPGSCIVPAGGCTDAGPALDRRGAAGRDSIRDNGRRAPPAHRAVAHCGNSGNGSACGRARWRVWRTAGIFQRPFTAATARAEPREPVACAGPGSAW